MTGLGLHKEKEMEKGKENEVEKEKKKEKEKEKEKVKKRGQCLPLSSSTRDLLTSVSSTFILWHSWRATTT